MIVDKTEDGCKKKLERFLAICKDMGIPISKEKTFQPSQVMSFVGYEIDIRLMEVRLPIDKLAKCHNLITVVLQKEKIRLRELQSIIDASGTYGYGALFGSQWFLGKWDTKWQKQNIAVLELYPIVLAVEIWGHRFENQCIYCHTDNIALVSVINKQTSKDPLIMFLIRRLVLHCLRNNVNFKAKPIYGSKNVLADALSRQQVLKSVQKGRNQDKNDNICTVTALTGYLTLRTNKTGPLFLNSSGEAVSRQLFQHALNGALNFCWLSRAYYKPHSFRIGFATDASAKGLSTETIRTLGRWKSDAFKLYIRQSDQISNL
ncbi:unnamed protein product [Mytilus coruscus]|uniref:Reverse transcriptase domain-containing protein n=1 Tax=Mytilus coruscus TaxID=42192 RepID=A0A6J8AM77_MYTCO|nr:unnamed protein product [Mytilus coruscus]